MLRRLAGWSALSLATYDPLREALCDSTVDSCSINALQHCMEWLLCSRLQVPHPSSPGHACVPVVAAGPAVMAVSSSLVSQPGMPYHETRPS